MSLIIALAMVTVLSVALVGALGFATASLRTVSVVSQQRATGYAADGAVQTAIQALRYNATAGSTAVGTACPSTNASAVGAQPAVAVTCQVVQTYTPGGASLPTYALWAVGSSASEIGININAATFGPLSLNGPVASNSPAVGAGGINSVAVAGGTLDLSGETLNATGTCSGTITVTVPADKKCSTGTNYPDPGYPSQALPALTSPNPSPKCTVSDGVLQFVPGYYTNAQALQAPDYSPGTDPLCKAGYLFFQPGVYYFDFGVDPGFPDTVWNVTQRVTGGQAKGWDPNTKTLPNQPNPGDSAAISCKTESDGATDGVQFVFGGASQMDVTASGATMELCPDPNPVGTNQQIAIYGQSISADPTPQTSIQVPTGAVPTPSTGWSNLPANLLAISPNTSTIDANTATYSMPSGATDTVTMSGYHGASSVVPAGATNVSYALKVAHSETSASAATNVSSLTATIGACAVSATRHTTTGTTVTLVTDTIPLTTATCIAAVQNNFSVSYKAIARSAKTFKENLDGIDLVVTYTAPAVRAQSGCTIVVNSCSVLVVGGAAGQAKFVSWGTVYTPLSSVNADVNGASVVVFRRGLVARAVTIAHIPSGRTLDACLAAGSPCSSPPAATDQTRVLLLTATVSGSVKLRALVSYSDLPALGAAALVLSWNVLRG